MTTVGEPPPGASPARAVSGTGAAYNVLHTLRNLRGSGITRVVSRNISAMQQWGSGEFRHHVCAVRRDDRLIDDFRALGIEPVVLDYAGPQSALRATAQLVRLIRERDIDLVQANQTLDFALAGAAAKVCGVPMAATVHWLMTYSPPRPSPWTRCRVWANTAARVALDRTLATRVVVVSEAVRRSYIDVVGPHFPTEKLDVVYPCLDPATPDVTVDRDTMRRDLGVAASWPVLLTVSRLEVVKGAQFLAPFMAELRRHVPRAVLLVAGEGSLRGLVERQVAELDLSHHVRLLGWREDVDALHAASDVFVLASETEAMPLAVLEAMRSGKPVVATAVGGSMELVEPGVTGALASPRDPRALARAVHEVVSSPGQAERMGVAGSRVVRERFELRASVRALEMLYRDLIGGAKRAGVPS